ncbi:heat shock Hsp20 [Achromatium sp. WMS2]|nr:heat shock Hsp20 [Achromatium sp. WMS2]
MFGSLTNFETALFNDFRQFQKDIDQAVGYLNWPTTMRSVARGTYPPINVGATPEQVDVYLFAAGLDTKTLDISIQQNLLSIAGRRQVPIQEQAVYYRNERFSGEFKRVISLPDDVNQEQVNAQYKDGILHISVRRQEASKPRRIEVK